MPYGDFGEHRQPYMPRPSKWYFAFLVVVFAVVVLIKVLAKAL